MPCHSGILKRGAKIEQKEHPWASEKVATKIAADHIKEDPNAYIKDAKSTLKPITAKKAKISDLKAASNQQRRWSKQAEKEAQDERSMAKRASRAGRPVQAKDLRQDAKLAHDFSKYRKKKADNYDLQAARIAAVKGD
jgi:hypothetical protein